MDSKMETLGTRAVEAAGRVSVLRWVIVSVLGIFVLLFLLSMGAMVTGASDLGQSHFAERARRDFLGFIIWRNLVLLMKGYGLMSAGFVVLCYPLVGLWVRGRVTRVTRYAVAWRTVLLVGVAVTLMVMRLFWKQPYFSAEAWYSQWYQDLLEFLPEAVTGVVFLVLFKVVPWVVVVVVAGYYLLALRNWMVGPRRGPQRVAGALAVVGGVLTVGMVVFSPGARGSHGKPDVAGGPQKKMNVLIIASDSLRGDRLSCNGYFREVSPNIDRLAAKSTNFTKCFTPIGSTLESMVGMLTSEYPHTHGFRQMFPSKELVEKVNREASTLPTVLGKAGYDTAVMGDWCAAIFNLTPLGFEEVQVSDFDNFKIWMSQAVYMHHFVIPLFFDNEFGYWLFPELQSFAFFLKPEVVTERVVKKLEAQGEDPFFWTVFYSCNHLNYHSPDPYYKMWADPDYKGKHKYMVSLNPDNFAANTDIGKEYAGMDRADVEQIRALYDGCTTQFDDCVGRIVATLEETGQLENTIIIITSDHGDDQFEPGVSFCHGITFSGGDQGNHIPFVLYVPGREGKKVDRIVRNIDYAPTILDLLEMPAEPKFEGVSLKPYVEEEAADLGLAYFGETSYLFFNRQIPGESPLEVPALQDTTHVDEDFDFHIVLQDKFQEAVVKTKERCLRTEEFKLVYTPGQEAPIHRLYHLASDPHCERDVKGEHPAVYRAMKKYLWGWIVDHEEGRVREIEGAEVEEEIAVPQEYLEIDWGK